MERKKITQCMKPHGKEGVETIKNMNKNHMCISDYAFECININNPSMILDIGCGGGINIERFLKLCPDANVDGLDYSEVSVAESTKHNQIAVDDGRCNIMQANVCDMPIGDKKYDIVSAFETIYFWPDIGETFKEVYRIVNDDGQFMIALGTDGNHPDDERWLNTVEGMSIYTKDDLETLLLNAGFSSVNSYVKEGEHILITIAKK